MSIFARQVRRYALAGDENLIESLRGQLTPEQINSLHQLFFETDDWTIRDAIVTIVQDCQGPLIDPIMNTALSSTNKETKLTALCILTKDRSLYLDFLSNGYISMESIDAAILKFKQSHTEKN